MQYEEMLTWLLFYTSLLDLRKIPPQDVADPGGLVTSQVIEAPDGALRFVLNASQSPRTQASRFLSELFGSGVQHIALATDDIFATLDRLKRNGVRLLDIPDNYYDDLEAKMDLPPDQLENLRDRKILYDREGEAEYFQVYTQTLISVSSSRSSSAANIAATAPPMHRSGSLPRHDSPPPDGNRNDNAPD